MHIQKLALRGLLIAGLAAMPAFSQTQQGDQNRYDQGARTQTYGGTDYGNRGGGGFSWIGLLGLLGLAGLLKRGGGQHVRDYTVDTRQGTPGRI